MRKLVWLLPIAAVLGGCSPEANERASQRDAIKLCWSDQGRKSHDPSVARFVASVCEKMETDYKAKWGRSP